MLNREPEQTPQNPTASIPAAERRVSAEELARAVSALEYAKAAERVAGVAPIGQVVDELGLDLTPEEIWAEVQRQRVQQVAENQATQAPLAMILQILHAAASQARLQPRLRRRLWAVRAVLVGALGLIIWGVTLNAAVQVTAPAVETTAPALSGSTIIVSGDALEETIPVQGKDVCIAGTGNHLILQGQARSVTVSGDANTLSGNAPKASTIAGSGNTVQWISTPQAKN